MADLYRVVSLAEFSEMQASGEFTSTRTGSNFDFGKWFWVTLVSARRWAMVNPTAYVGGYKIVSVTVDDAILSTAHQSDNQDGIGHAVLLEHPVLAGVGYREVE
jgi:hypothetical protein